MKRSTLIISFVSIIVIIGMAIWNTWASQKTSLKEGLQTNNNENNSNNPVGAYILVGDSILNNESYVKGDSSVEELLKKKVETGGKGSVLMVAKDNATISDVYQQIEKIPPEYNNSSTKIFLSAGGNNILKGKQIPVKNIFEDYLALIKTIKSRFQFAQLYVLNLYLPANPRYQSYAKQVDQWNQLIQSSSVAPDSSYTVVDLFLMLKEPNDFVYGIEPSATASEKIATALYLS